MNFLSSFKGRIITVVMLLLITTLAISNFLSYRQISSLMKTDIDNYSTLKVSSTSEKVNAWFQTIKDGLVGTAPDFSVPRSDEQLILMVQQINASTKATDIFVGFKDGRSYSAKSGKHNVSEYDPRSRGWYKEAKLQGKTIITPMYKDAFTNNLLVSIAEPFYKNGQLEGVLLADIELNVLEDIVKASAFAHATTSLYDEKGTTIASTETIDNPGQSKLADNAAFTQLQQSMLAEDSGKVTLSVNGKDKISYFESVKLDDQLSWHILVTLDKESHHAIITDSLEDSIITAVILILIVSLIIYVALNKLYQPIIALKTTVQDLAQGNGDLTQRLEVTSKDDLGQIAEAVNTFIMSLQTIMLDISQSTTHISSGIEQLRSQTEHNNTVLIDHASETDQVVVAVTEMSSTADSVAQSAAQSATFTQQ